MAKQEFTSGGFELYVPPTKFPKPDEPARFVMLDDINDTFYQVVYEGPGLQNMNTWKDLDLHTINDPAIVFPPKQLDAFEARLSLLATGFLVSITFRSPEIFIADWLGAVHVYRLPEHRMNWGALESLKGEELPTEMRAGLLRYVFDRRPGLRSISHTYMTPRNTLDNMIRPWHVDGASLNWELDSRFTGANVIPREQSWRLIDRGPRQIAGNSIMKRLRAVLGIARDWIRRIASFDYYDAVRNFFLTSIPQTMYRVFN